MAQDGRSATPEAAKIAIDRLSFFSDAVVAIAMTLLAIELPVPNASTAASMLAQAGDALTEYLAFLISFVVIATYWRGHHRVYRYVADATPRLVSANLLWLLGVVATPFAMRVLYAGDGIAGSDFPVRFGFYALLTALTTWAFLVSEKVIVDGGLLEADAPPGLLAWSRTRSVVIISTFLVSIPVAVLVHGWAFVVWALLPLWMRVTERVVARRHPEYGTARE